MLTLVDKEKLIRKVTELQLEPDFYITASTNFPKVDFLNSSEVKKSISDYQIELEVFNNKLQKVQQFTSPGWYGLVAKIEFKIGVSTQRYLSIYKLGDKNNAIDWQLKLNESNWKKFSQFSDIELPIIQKYEQVISNSIGENRLEQMKKNPTFAKVLSGMSYQGFPFDAITDNTAKVKNRFPYPKAGKFDDVFARERQWWVNLKCKLFPVNLTDTPKPLEPAPEYSPILFHEKSLLQIPDELKQQFAPEVRPGTLKEADMKENTRDRLDAILKEWADNDDQAFAVCIVRNGVIVFHQAYGKRDNKQIFTNTKSWMASITKTQSASCMMMLVDRGLIDLDTPITQYLPELKESNPSSKLTVRQLYTHTAGLGDWPGILYRDELPDIEQRIRLIVPFLNYGKEWKYNGQSYTLGGKIIERISGETMPAFYWNHLWGPLNGVNTEIVGTHADCFSIPLDMAKFGQMLLNEGSYGKYRFFKKDTFKKMLPHRLTEILGKDTKKSFGLGLDGTLDKIGHGAASSAIFQIDRKEKLVVVMTRNTRGKNQDKFQGKFQEILKDCLLHPEKNNK